MSNETVFVRVRRTTVHGVSAGTVGELANPEHVGSVGKRRCEAIPVRFGDETKYIKVGNLEMLPPPGVIDISHARRATR